MEHATTILPGLPGVAEQPPASAQGCCGRLSPSADDWTCPVMTGCFPPRMWCRPALGNLIAGPLQGRCRRRGATVFLDLATLEPA
jgi:hypothetical protein